MKSAKRILRNLKMLESASRALPNLVRARPGARFSVADAFEDRVDQDPEHPAIVFEDRSLSYRELDEAANRVAHWARSQGLEQGDVVALWMENRPEFVICWLGLAKRGIVTALINTNLLGRPLAHTLEISGARHLLLDAALEENWASSIDAFEPKTLARLEVWASDGKIADAKDLDADLARRPTARPPRATRRDLTSNDRLFYIYTSGTTGLPKAANFSHARFIATASALTGLGAIGPDDRMYIVLPLYHTAGGVMALGGTLLAGATAVVARSFSASRFWEDCVRHDVTVFQYIGELCRYLANSPRHPDERRHRLRLCVGNGLRPEVWPDFQKRFAIPHILEFYGATEGNVSFVNLDDKVGSVGRMPGLLRAAAGIHLVRFDVEREEVVRGRDGFCVECEVDEPGEAIGRITKASRFEGYSDAAATEKKILRDVFKKGDAYFRTGDLLRRDADDYFYFVDRIGDTFRWKGENVSTNEVAEVVSACAHVLEANVYGVAVPGADGRAGMASLVVDEAFDPIAFGAETQAQLASYARPLFLRLRRQIETTGTFKHRKVESVQEGFDPGQIGDPLYFLDVSEGRYVPLDVALHQKILRGEVRL